MAKTSTCVFYGIGFCENGNGFTQLHTIPVLMYPSLSDNVLKCVSTFLGSGDRKKWCKVTLYHRQIHNKPGLLCICLCIVPMPIIFFYQETVLGQNSILRSILGIRTAVLRSVGQFDVVFLQKANVNAFSYDNMLIRNVICMRLYISSNLFSKAVLEQFCLCDENNHEISF